MATQSALSGFCAFRTMNSFASCNIQVSKTILSWYRKWCGHSHRPYCYRVIFLKTIKAQRVKVKTNVLSVSAT